MNPSSENIADIIGTRAAASPEATAIIEAGRRLDYRSLDGAIWRAAGWFRRRGVAPGDVVGLAMGNHALHLVAAYALARVGGVQLQLNPAEPPASREALAKRFRAAVVFSDADADPAWLADSGSTDPALRAPGGDAPWKIVFTSGTTGAPRAVRHTHATQIKWRGISQSAIPLHATDRYLAAVEMKFVAGLLRCMDTLQAGGTVVLPESRDQSEGLLRDILRHRITYLYLPASWLHPLLALVQPRGMALPEVRILRTGSMVASRGLRDAVVSRLTPNLLISYGTNEVGTPITTAKAPDLARHPETLGAASRDIELGIADEEGRALPAGEIGQVRMRTGGMPAGYLDDAEASAKAFRDGWFYPGDLGLLSPEGLLFYKGRTDERMNFTGIKIYPSEIEAALLEHPAVAEAAAFPVDSEAHQHLPAAAVVLRPGAPPADLDAWCRERLGAHAPVVIATVTALPRSERGKILKRVLAEQVRQAMDQSRNTR